MEGGREAQLSHFVVYNSTFDKSEATEHEKILYYWPPDCPEDAKMKNVGLAEAIIKYTSTFTDKPCEIMRTKKARWAMYNPEPECWIVMGVTLPSSNRTTAEGVAVTDYHDGDVQDIVLEALVMQAYRMYKLFHGTFTHILERTGRDALVHVLGLFFPQYIRSIDVSRTDVVDAFDGIQFLPLDKNTYLRVQCFINLTESTFPCIKYTVFLYNDHLVWSGLEQDDMRVLYKYLTGGPANVEGSGAAGGSLFVTGPEDIKNPETPINAPRLYVATVDETDELHLIIYQTNGVKLCFLVESSHVMDVGFYQRLDTFIQPHTRALDEIISDRQSQRAQSIMEIQYKYLYFNHMNLAQKSSFMQLPKKSGDPVISSLAPEYVQYLTDMHGDFSRSQEDSEIILKTRGDWWVVGRKSDQREFFVILNQKNANLIDINEEIRRLSATHFGNIFFID